MNVQRHVVFSHGLHSGPWGRKISAMAFTARAEGYAVHSIDYQGMDAPADRVAKLVESCQPLKGELVLVGSSLGGYVSIAAGSLLHARGVFLMAPAIYVAGLPPLRPQPLDCPTAVVHGWRDEVVPVEHSIRFARENSAALHVLDGDHGLHAQLRMIKILFEYFLIGIDLPPKVELGASKRPG